MFRILVLFLAITLSPRATLAADVIGLSLPLKGRFAPISQRIEFGAQMAIENLRAAGHKFELKLVDDGCDPKSVAAQANDFLEAGVKIVVGPLCFKQAIGLVKALNTSNGETPTIPVITVNTRNRLLERLRSINSLPLYSLSNSHNAEAAAVVKHILPRFKDKPFAIVDDGSVYGRSLSDEIRILGEQAGFKAIITTNFRPQQTTQISLLRRLKKSGIEAMFVAAGPRDIITITRGMKKLDLEWDIATGEQAVVLPYISGALDVPSGLLMVREKGTSPGRKAIIAKQLKVSLENLEPSLLTGYALIEIAAQTILRKNTTLPKGELKTVLGKIEFDKEGRAPPFEYGLFNWNEGSFNAVEGK